MINKYSFDISIKKKSFIKFKILLDIYNKEIFIKNNKKNGFEYPKSINSCVIIFILYLII